MHEETIVVDLIDDMLNSVVINAAYLVSVGKPPQWQTIAAITGTRKDLLRSRVRRFLAKDPDYFEKNSYATAIKDLEDLTLLVARWTRELRKLAKARAEACYQQEAKDKEFPITGRVYYRNSTNEWILEVEGKINDNYVLCRHTQPGTLAVEKVLGLPSLYEEENEQTE